MGNETKEITMLADPNCRECNGLGSYYDVIADVRVLCKCTERDIEEELEPKI